MYKVYEVRNFENCVIWRGMFINDDEAMSFIKNAFYGNYTVTLSEGK